MNKEILLVAVAGITVGLIVAVLAAFRTQNEPTAGVLRRGGMAALLVYAVIAAPVFVRSGMTLVGLVLLVVVLALPLAGTALARNRHDGSPSQPEALVCAVVGAGLAAVVLIAAGQTISLLGRVDPRMTVVIVAVVAGLLVAGQGLAASSRAGSLAMWLTIVFVLVSLALGFLLGGFGEVVSPIIETDAPQLLEILAVAVAVLVLGWADNGLRALRAVGDWPLWRVFGGTVAVVVLICLGQLMFLGGSILAPSLQFFVVPANIDILPVLAAVVLALLTVVFAGLLAAVLAGIGALGAPGGGLAVNSLWVTAGAAVAAIVALVDPGSEAVVVAASLIAAALVGAQLGSRETTRGIVVGLVVAVVAAVVLALIGSFKLGGAFVLATAVVIAAAAVASSVGGSTRKPDPEADPADREVTRRTPGT